jgi:hypothetical protein
VTNTQQKSSATFLPFFDKSAKNSAAVSSGRRFLWGHFCVLRPKFRPVGNTFDYIVKGLEAATSTSSIAEAILAPNKRQSNEHLAGPSRLPFWLRNTGVGKLQGTCPSWAVQPRQRLARQNKLLVADSCIHICTVSISFVLLDDFVH